MMKRIAAAASAIAMLAATPAIAAPQDFRIHNETGEAILELHVSPSGDDHWGPDILGVDVMAADASGVVTFDRDSGQCLYDIKVTYQSGEEGDWRQINLCETTDITLGGE